MKCPYRIDKIFEELDGPQITSEKTTFSECVRTECPFYYMTKITGYYPDEGCRKADKEWSR